MKPYQQSSYQTGPVPQTEVSRNHLAGALAAFLFLAGGMAFVGTSEPATCAAPQQVASK